VKTKKFYKKDINVRVAIKLSSLECQCKCDSDLCHFTILDQHMLNAWKGLRMEWGRPIGVTSVFRCQSHNAAVGGVNKSYHTTGSAIDLAKPEGDTWLFEELVMKYFSFVKVYKNFIHAHVVS